MRGESAQAKLRRRPNPTACGSVQTRVASQAIGDRDGVGRPCPIIVAPMGFKRGAAESFPERSGIIVSPPCAFYAGLPVTRAENDPATESWVN